MKKLFTMLLALIMLFILAACGGNGSTTTPPASRGNNETVESGGLYDLTDDKIRAYDENFSELQGDARTTMLAKIPAEIKKAVGTVGAGLCNIQPDQADDSGYLFGMMLYVPDSAGYKTLTDYYKSLGGTMKDETEEESFSQLQIDYSWGKLSDCLYKKTSGSAGDTISVIFTID